MKKITEIWLTQFIDRANQGDVNCEHEFEYSDGWTDVFTFRKAICKKCLRLEIQRKDIVVTEVPDPVTPFQSLESTLNDTPVKVTPYISADDLNALEKAGDIIGTPVAKPIEEPIVEIVEP